MKWSLERKNHLSRGIAKELDRKKLLKTTSKEVLFQEIRRAFVLFEKEWEEMEAEAQHKLKSIKRGIQVGSSEWDTLFLRFMEESFSKKSSLFARSRR